MAYPLDIARRRLQAQPFHHLPTPHRPAYPTSTPSTHSVKDAFPATCPPAGQRPRGAGPGSQQGTTAVLHRRSSPTTCPPWTAGPTPPRTPHSPAMHSASPRSRSTSPRQAASRSRSSTITSSQPARSTPPRQPIDERPQPRPQPRREDHPTDTPTPASSLEQTRALSGRHVRQSVQGLFADRPVLLSRLSGRPRLGRVVNPELEGENLMHRVQASGSCPGSHLLLDDQRAFLLVGGVEVVRLVRVDVARTQRCPGSGTAKMRRSMTACRTSPSCPLSSMSAIYARGGCGNAASVPVGGYPAAQCPEHLLAVLLGQVLLAPRSSG